jgi:ankyrin repeat protein
VATDDGSNRTPLIWAVLYKREETVAALLAAGANPRAVFKNVFENGQKTCLQIARERSTPRIVATLEKYLD